MSNLRCQVTFLESTEGDIVGYLENTKKAERHFVFKHALRMLMHNTGYYSRQKPEMIQVEQNNEIIDSTFEEKITKSNKNSKKDIIHIFDEYNE